MTVPTQDEAKQLRAKFDLETGRPAPSVRLDITLEEFALSWLESIRLYRKLKTFRSYEQNWRIHIKPVIGRKQVRHLHRAELRTFLEGVTGRFDEQRRSRESVRVVYSTLRALLSQAVEDGLLMSNPAFGLGRRLRLSKIQGGTEDRVKAMTADQLAHFLATTRGVDPTFSPLALFLARTGVRLGEALGAEWSDLDLVAGGVRIARTMEAPRKVDNIKERIGTTKSGKARVVDLASDLQTVLRQLEAAVRREALRQGRAPARWVFTTREGRPLDEGRVRKDFAQVIKKAELPRHLTPHCLRHTFATLLIAAGAPLPYIQQQLGHSSIQVTVDVYGRWLPRGDRQWIEKLVPAASVPAQSVTGTGGGGSGRVQQLTDRPGDGVAMAPLGTMVTTKPSRETTQVVEKNGAGERTRTVDLLITNYQQARIDGRGWTRLDDLLSGSVQSCPVLSPRVQRLGGQFGGQTCR